MAKKIYNQPQTDVFAFQTETLLQDLTVSINTGTPPGGGGMHAPRRGDLIP